MVRYAAVWVCFLAAFAAGCSGCRGARAQPESEMSPAGLRARDPQPFGQFAFLGSFERELGRFAESTPRDVAARAPAYAPWKPAQAPVKHLELFEEPKSHGHPLPDAALDERERAALRERGFVVSERLGAESHAALYHRVYERDQPVFITADSVLHAWHRSYDAVLEELEATYMIDALSRVLAGMAEALPAAREAHDGGVFEDATDDADVYLAVARSLLAGEWVGPERIVNALQVRALLGAAQQERAAKVMLFGRPRRLDFSQFKPRGHYENRESLGRYFRAVMWLGRTEFELDGPGARRDLAVAIVLYELLERAKRFDTFRQMDALIRTFVGRADGMDLRGVGALLAAAGKRPDRLDDADLGLLLERVARSPGGTQRINAQLRDSDPDDPRQVPLPRSFTFFPQRFTLDAWALGQLVYDRVVHGGRKIERHVPSGVDVAFAVFGNDDAAPILARRIEQGLPFQANLLAARSTIDARPAARWDDTLYDGWLSALRALSEPTTSPQFPAVMRTHDWSLRRMQTQLASWAELRHDTILYVKQSYGMGITCEYPTGFVELQPEFWTRLEHTARRAAAALRGTPYPAQLARARGYHAAHFERFARTVATLRAIAERELHSRPLTAEQLEFLRQAVEVRHGGMCGEPPRWDGWFIELYYRGQKDALEWDALVADVHTSPAAGVLHAATGGVDLMVAMIDRGGDTMAFAGPVAQYREFVQPPNARLSDSEWKQQLREGKAPPRPEWTANWVVPGAPRRLAGYE